MTIGAVIITYNSRDTIDDCLRSLEDEHPDELIVIDNDSEDRTWELISDKNLVRNDQNVGFARCQWTLSSTGRRPAKLPVHGHQKYRQTAI